MAATAIDVALITRIDVEDHLNTKWAEQETRKMLDGTDYDRNVRKTTHLGAASDTRL
jgi:hypothetical protein